MESINGIGILEYIRVPSLPNNPFNELNTKVDKLIVKLRSGGVTGGVTQRVAANIEELTKLKYVLTYNYVGGEELEKAAKRIETLMTAIHHDADLLLTL